MEIREITDPEGLAAAYPVMRQLRTDLTPDGFASRFVEMQPQGYRLFALEDGGRVVALAGIAVMTNLYHGRHVFVYDLVTDEAHRSRGYGARLLGFIGRLARDHGCEGVALTSAFHRTGAHRFYQEKMGYRRTSYLFHHDLDGPSSEEYPAHGP